MLNDELQLLMLYDDIIIITCYYLWLLFTVIYHANWTSTGLPSRTPLGHRSYTIFLTRFVRDDSRREILISRDFSKSRKSPFAKYNTAVSN